ncbi:MAG: RNA polymerase sigma factor [Crocinitomicaceae bacterium]|nr:RNA polymerase sigma factor [Crocinitomicaceae bacterium]
MTAFEFQNQVVNLEGFIHQFALKYARNEEDAKDLAQDTMLKACMHYDKFRTNTNLKGWLRVIMRNIFINSYRRSSRRIVKFDSDSFTVQQGETDFYSPENICNKDFLDKQISMLADEVREPFVYHMTGFKYEEISEKMNIPIGTVKSRIFQARKTLSGNIENN